MVWDETVPSRRAERQRLPHFLLTKLKLYQMRQGLMHPQEEALHDPS
jgi:hypothetical protein